MSEDTFDSGTEAEAVGYGVPPRAHQFQKGRSGNPNGRPKKQPQADAIDVTAVLDGSVRVRKNGKLVTMAKKEVTLRKQTKAALGGDRRAIVRLLAQFEKVGVLSGRPVTRPGGGVVVLPTGHMPWAMAQIMVSRFGAKGTYSEIEVAVGRTLYLETRTQEEALIDDAIGYPDLPRSNG